MIDPRALQQHFKNIYKNEQPKTKNYIPRIPDVKPLTAIQPIPDIAEKVGPGTIKITELQQQKELHETVQAAAIFEQVSLETPQTILTSIELSTKETDNKTLDPLDTKQTTEPYDPYGYYLGSNS